VWRSDFILLANQKKMSTIEQKFMRATQAVADGEIQLTDNQRNIFYGLQKQAIDGDCNVAEPPR
jgi:hypothetical protein